MGERSGRRRGVAAALAVGLGLALGSAAAQDSPTVEEYFPLDVGRAWTYTLKITSGRQTRTIEYTTRVARVEEVAGTPCAVLEDHSGEKVLQVNWYALDDGRLAQLQRHSGRTTTYCRREGDKVGPAGRVLLDRQALLALPETTSWEWASPDLSLKGRVTLQKRGERLRVRGVGEVECLLLLDEGTATVGGKTATIERRVWLAPGIGCVQELTKISTPDGDTLSEAQLIRHDRS